MAAAPISRSGRAMVVSAGTMVLGDAEFVVVAHDGDVLRDAQAQPVAGQHHADGQAVVRAQDGGGPAAGADAVQKLHGPVESGVNVPAHLQDPASFTGSPRPENASR